MIFFHTGILPLLQSVDFDKWSLQFWVFTLSSESKCPISVFILLYSKGGNLHNLIAFQGVKIQFQYCSKCILIVIVMLFLCLVRLLFHPLELLMMDLEMRFLWVDPEDLRCSVNRYKGAVLMNQSQKDPVSGHSLTLSSGTTLTLRDQLWT